SLLAWSGPVRAQTAECVRQHASVRDFGAAAKDARRLVEGIAASIGLSGTIDIVPCTDENKVRAWLAPPDLPGIDPGEYVVFDPTWTKEVLGRDKDEATFVFGHELGHFLGRHFTRSDIDELAAETEADRFAGCAVALRDGTWPQVEAIVYRIRDKQRSGNYPNQKQSLAAARSGYESCSVIAPKRRRARAAKTSFVFGGTVLAIAGTALMTESNLWWSGQRNDFEVDGANVGAVDRASADAFSRRRTLNRLGGAALGVGTASLTIGVAIPVRRKRPLEVTDATETD
ncbi:MAG: M48 family metalloprotease, partial [Myxococcota bacterium]